MSVIIKKPSAPERNKILQTAVTEIILQDPFSVGFTLDVFEDVPKRIFFT